MEDNKKLTPNKKYYIVVFPWVADDCCYLLEGIFDFAKEEFFYRGVVPEKSSVFSV